MDPTDDREWLEADGLGGFASGTATGIRTRRYHALLLAATTAPTGRMVLVNGFDAWVTTPAGRYAITSQRYSPGVVYPDGAGRIASFSHEPWPRWEFLLEDGTRIQQEIVAFHERSRVAVSWKLLRGEVGTTLEVRPFLSGRDYHSLHHENSVARIASSAGSTGTIIWHPYDGVLPVISASNGRYHDEPDWYRRFLYAGEAARGLDAEEDLFSPGTLTWNLSAGAAHWVIGTGEGPATSRLVSDIHVLRETERARRAAFSSSLERAADAFIVRRGSGRTIIAGYPWFTDWGRDTFIALPGLCLETGRLDDARDILLAWAASVSEGMLPNRFSDSGESPEFNAVDASLWFVIAVHAFGETGVRTLAPFEPGYTGTYGGGVRERDSAYHQGTAWPWLLHAYASACARVRPHEQACEDIDRILAALEAHLDEAGLGHVSEVLSGDAPHAPGGCPFQAWSLGALLRVQALRTQLRATVEAGVGQ